MEGSGSREMTSVAARDESISEGDKQPESVDIGRVQLLLAEKRTSLAAMRTGIAIFTLPLSVTTVLITTSRFYDFLANLHYLIPLLVLCVLLVVLGTYLIVISLLKFQREARHIGRIKARNPDWQHLID